MFLPHVESLWCTTISKCQHHVRSCLHRIAHLKHGQIRHYLSCFVIWIIRRDSIGFRCDVLYFCHHVFKYVPVPLGYPLYTAAKRMKPSAGEHWCFCYFGNPELVRCTWHTPRNDLCERHQSQQSLWMYFGDTVITYPCMFWLVLKHRFTQFYSRILCLQKKTVPWISESKYKLSDFARPVIYSQTW